MVSHRSRTSSRVILVLLFVMAVCFLVELASHQNSLKSKPPPYLTTHPLLNTLNTPMNKPRSTTLLLASVRVQGAGPVPVRAPDPDPG